MTQDYSAAEQIFTGRAKWRCGYDRAIDRKHHWVLQKPVRKAKDRRQEC